MYVLRHALEHFTIKPVPSLLSRLFTARSGPKETPAPAVEATLYPGQVTLEVVGEASYQDALWHVVGGRHSDPVRYETEAILEPEPENPYDANAIKVLVQGAVVGYLSREDAAAYKPGLLRLVALSPTGRVALECAIVGGGPRADGIGFLGVFLDHDPVDFGLALELVVRDGSLRTGLSEAIATDVGDDSYDLSWYRDLSVDAAVAIEQLRTMLETERDPIDRHYMLSELGRCLYRRRDAFESELYEFDAICQQHDAEMVSIRPALIAKFGVAPVVEMYRQAAIRWQKAHDWLKVRHWAQRGIAFYGEVPGRVEAVEDLHKRLAYATAKIDAAAHPRPPKPRHLTVTVTSTAAAALETLVCTSCGMSFERMRTRGRKPKTCPACRGLASPAHLN